MFMAWKPKSASLSVLDAHSQQWSIRPLYEDFTPADVRDTKKEVGVGGSLAAPTSPRMDPIERAYLAGLMAEGRERAKRSGADKYFPFYAANRNTSAFQQELVRKLQCGSSRERRTAFVDLRRLNWMDRTKETLLDAGLPAALMSFLEANDGWDEFYDERGEEVCPRDESFSLLLTFFDCAHCISRVSDEALQSLGERFLARAPGQAMSMSPCDLGQILKLLRFCFKYGEKPLGSNEKAFLKFLPRLMGERSLEDEYWPLKLAWVSCLEILKLHEKRSLGPSSPSTPQQPLSKGFLWESAPIVVGSLPWESPRQLDTPPWIFTAVQEPTDVVDQNQGEAKGHAELLAEALEALALLSRDPEIAGGALLTEAEALLALLSREYKLFSAPFEDRYDHCTDFRAGKMRPDDTTTQVSAAFRAMNSKKRKAYADTRQAAEQLTRVLASVAESAGSDAEKRRSVVRKLYECKDAQFVVKVRRAEKASQRFAEFCEREGGWVGSLDWVPELPRLSRGLWALFAAEFGLKECSYPDCYQEVAEMKRGRLEKCSACKTVQYCDEDCQKAHWKAHKPECQGVKAAAKKARVSAV
ncbi:hypothetical protein KFL_000160535 [Klebsormidium nitens]|uniref:MYND-type domain-containing protein n=1 Tax=Klebsormidium nitens TaxID=105231 RepID=A0A1Y1HLV5_KLENI|nr:hypothetical protein KFL_000160535 [Klebsormidium nitens]|eukprot:GAQ78652.1 hypothetical protein KFL_000160535 [Klebsormidium nitens]